MILLSFVLSSTAFATTESDAKEIRQIREAFAASVNPSELNFQLAEFYSCEVFSLETGDRKVTLASHYFLQSESDPQTFIENGIGQSMFKFYKLEEQGLISRVKENQFTHISAFRVSVDDKLIFEISSNDVRFNKLKLPKSLISAESNSLYYGKCSLNPNEFF